MCNRVSVWTSSFAAAMLRVIFAFALTVSFAQAETPSTRPGSGTGADAGLSNSDYRLGPFDQVRIRVVAWQPARAEVFEWKAINGDYSVGPGGKLSVPLIGDVQAADVTTSELGETIAERLQTRIGLAQRPDASVEIIKFRPFYVVGDVASAGEYPYRPGMTVIQAFTIAGGLPRREMDAQRVERESIGWRGELRELLDEQTRLTAKRIRLEAELNGANELTFSDSIGPSEEIAQAAIDQETLTFKARKEALSIAVRSLEQLKDHFVGEVSSLAAQNKPQQTLLALAQQDKRLVEDNYKNRAGGLRVVTEQRYLGAQRDLATAEGESLRLGSRLEAAKLEIRKAETSLLDVRSKFTTDALNELTAARARLAQISQKIATTRGLVSQANKDAPKLANANLSFSIVRRTTSSFDEISADETTLVEPGDTIKVKCCDVEDGSDRIGSRTVRRGDSNDRRLR